MNVVVVLFARSPLLTPSPPLLALAAALAAMLPLIQSQHYAFRNLRFLVLINAYIPSPPPSAGFGGVSYEEHMKTEYVDIPTLHIIGQDNDIVTPEESIAVSERFVSPIVYKHKFGERRNGYDVSRESSSPPSLFLSLPH